MIKIKKIVAVCLMSLVVVLSGCGSNKGGSDDLTGDNVLRIYALKAGLGVDWIQEVIEDFKKQDWVQEKYPGLQVGFTFNEMESFAPTKIRGGKGVCNYDLLFSSYLGSETGDYASDLTETVYNKTIPGENVKFVDKVPQSVLDSTAQLSQNSDKVSYKTVVWSGVATGWVYNAELLSELGYEMPVTTDEFLQVCAEITALKTDKYNKGYAIMSSQEGNDYFAYSFVPLLSQYMGIDGVSNFYNGIDAYGRRSNKIFEMPGRLQVLKFLEKLYSFNNKYISTQADELGFMEAQLGFLNGNGVFMPNGSWFDNEMKDLREKSQSAGRKVYDVQFMRMPILSDILEVLPDNTIEDDTELRAVVRAIDRGETSYEGVSKESFDRVAYARAIVSGLPSHDAIVPTYADNKDIAYDFLLFMGSDKGIEAAYRGNGCPLPFNYDIKTKNPTLYNSLTSGAKSRVEIMYGNSVYDHEIWIPADNTRLVKYGGIDFLRVPVSSIYGYLSALRVTKTAQDMYDETLSYWTVENFNRALQKAGY